MIKNIYVSVFADSCDPGFYIAGLYILSLLEWPGKREMFSDTDLYIWVFEVLI